MDFNVKDEEGRRNLSKKGALSLGKPWNEEIYQQEQRECRRLTAEGMAERAADEARTARRERFFGRIGDAIGDFFTNVIYLVRNLAYFALSILCLGGYIMFLCSLYVGFTLVRDCVGGMNVIDAFKAHPCFLPFLLVPIVLQILKGIVDPN